MTWFNIATKFNILKCAAVFVAHFVFASVAHAQDVTFRSDDNSVAVSGRFVAFDGDVATILTQTGPVSFRAQGMECSGTPCPDFENYVPNLRITGASQIGDVLIPALIDVYARDNGWTVREDAAGFQMSTSDGRSVFDITLSVVPPDQAFAGFVAHNADVLLSMRELRRTELDAAARAGLGRLDTARQGRILALDALVPVASPALNARSISLTELTQALSGENSAFDVQIAGDLGGQLEGFEDRFMTPFGRSIPRLAGQESTQRDAIERIETGTNSLGLVPFGAIRNTQPLALTGPCGLQSKAQFVTMKTEDYPLTFPMFLYLPRRNQHPQIVDFLNWLRSPSAQLVIRRAGFVDLAAVPIPLADQGDRLSNAILNAGSEVPLIELQRMMRILSARVRMSSTFRFEPGSTRLDGQSRSNVMQLAQAIRDGQFGGRELIFVGFSDGRGPATANRDLSAARAESVRRDVERALGGSVPSNVDLQTEAFGEALPMACDDTIWGQQTNRRVELWVRDAG